MLLIIVDKILIKSSIILKNKFWKCLNIQVWNSNFVGYVNNNLYFNPYFIKKIVFFSLKHFYKLRFKKYDCIIYFIINFFSFDLSNYYNNFISSNISN